MGPVWEDSLQFKYQSDWKGPHVIPLMAEHRTGSLMVMWAHVQIVSETFLLSLNLRPKKGADMPRGNLGLPEPRVSKYLWFGIFPKQSGLCKGTHKRKQTNPGWINILLYFDTFWAVYCCTVSHALSCTLLLQISNRLSVEVSTVWSEASCLLSPNSKSSLQLTAKIIVTSNLSIKKMLIKNSHLWVFLPEA